MDAPLFSDLQQNVPRPKELPPLRSQPSTKLPPTTLGKAQASWKKYTASEQESDYEGGTKEEENDQYYEEGQNHGGHVMSVRADPLKEQKKKRNEDLRSSQDEEQMHSKGNSRQDEFADGMSKTSDPTFQGRPRIKSPQPPSKPKPPPGSPPLRHPNRASQTQLPTSYYEEDNTTQQEYAATREHDEEQYPDAQNEHAVDTGYYGEHYPDEQYEHAEGADYYQQETSPDEQNEHNEPPPPATGRPAARRSRGPSLDDRLSGKRAHGSPSPPPGGGWAAAGGGGGGGGGEGRRASKRSSFDPHYEMHQGYDDEAAAKSIRSVSRHGSLSVSPLGNRPTSPLLQEKLKTQKAIQTANQAANKDHSSSSEEEVDESTSEGEASQGHYPSAPGNEEDGGDERTPLTPREDGSVGRGGGKRGRKRTRGLPIRETLAALAKGRLRRPGRRMTKVGDEASLQRHVAAAAAAGGAERSEVFTGKLAHDLRKLNPRRHPKGHRSPFKWLGTGLAEVWLNSSHGERAAAISLFWCMWAEIYCSVPLVNAPLAAAGAVLLSRPAWLGEGVTQKFYWLFTALVFLSFFIDVVWMASTAELKAQGLLDYIDRQEEMLGNETPNVDSVFKFSAVMTGFNFPFKLFFWYDLLSRSPFGQHVLHTLNKRALLFVPVCRTSQHPLKEVQNRLIAMFWLQLVVGTLLLALAIIVALFMQWAVAFVADDFGLSLTAVCLIKGLTSTGVAAHLLTKMEPGAALQLFGCLAFPGCAGWRRAQRARWARAHGGRARPRVALGDARYLRRAAGGKLLDWAVGVYMWAVMGARSAETFSSGNSSVAGVMAGMVFLLVVGDIWLVFLGASVYHLFVNQLSREAGSSEDDGSGSSEYEESSSSEEESSSSEGEGSSSSGGEGGSSSGSSADSGERQRQRRLRRRRKEQRRAAAAAAVAGGQGVPPPRAVDNALLRGQGQQLGAAAGGGYNFDFARVFSPRPEGPGPAGAPPPAAAAAVRLADRFLLTPEEFGSYWESPALASTAYACRVQLVPTVEVLSNHLQARFFFVVASGKVAALTKIYAAAQGTVAGGGGAAPPVLFLMEMVFNREQRQLELTFKCQQPELTPAFVRYLSLRDVVGTHSSM